MTILSMYIRTQLAGARHHLEDGIEDVASAIHWLRFVARVLRAERAERRERRNH